MIWDGPASLDVDFVACVLCGTWLIGAEPGAACLACTVAVFSGGDE